jgi:D-3-phosphoglycerate dehydrogenase
LSEPENALKKIAVGASSFGAAGGEAADLLRKNGYAAAENPFGRKLTVEELINHAKGAVGLLAGLETLGEEAFAALPELRAVARIGIGAENIDFEAAERRGIRVSVTPEAPAYAVAEMTLAALLSVARNIVAANTDTHQRKWQKRMGFSIRGSSILLVGYGRTARVFAELLKPFSPELLVYDPYVPEHDGRELSDLLPLADVVSLHASGNRRILGAGEFALMKAGSVLLNGARGALVDETALVDSLKAGKPAAYWADVFSSEPYDGPLCDAENAVLTPHIATYTAQCRREMEKQAVVNLLHDLRGTA